MGKEEKVLEPLAKLIRQKATELGLPMESQLEVVLAKIAKGNVGEFANVPAALQSAVCSRIADALEAGYGNSLETAAATAAFREGNYAGAMDALVSAARQGLILPQECGCNTLYAPDFFARDAKLVAEQLCGSTLVRSDGEKWSALITSTCAYKGQPKDERITHARAGTMGYYTTHGKDVLIISAHEDGRTSMVGVWGMTDTEHNYNMSETGALTEAREHDGKVIGMDAPFLIHPRDASTDLVGTLRVVKRAKNDSKKALAAYDLK